MRAIFKLLSCIIIFLAPFGGHAAEKGNTIALKPYAPAEMRKPSAEKVLKFKQDRDFKYETDYSVKISIWDIIGSWLAKHFFGPIIGKHAFTIWQVIEY